MTSNASRGDASRGDASFEDALDHVTVVSGDLRAFLLPLDAAVQLKTRSAALYAAAQRLASDERLHPECRPELSVFNPENHAFDPFNDEYEPRTGLPIYENESGYTLMRLARLELQPKTFGGSVSEQHHACMIDQRADPHPDEQRRAGDARALWEELIPARTWSRSTDASLNAYRADLDYGALVHRAGQNLHGLLEEIRARPDSGCREDEETRTPRWYATRSVHAAAHTRQCWFSLPAGWTDALDAAPMFSVTRLATACFGARLRGGQVIIVHQGDVIALCNLSEHMVTLLTTPAQEALQAAPQLSPAQVRITHDAGTAGRTPRYRSGRRVILFENHVPGVPYPITKVLLHENPPAMCAVTDWSVKWYQLESETLSALRDASDREAGEAHLPLQDDLPF